MKTAKIHKPEKVQSISPDSNDTQQGKDVILVNKRFDSVKKRLPSLSSGKILWISLILIILATTAIGIIKFRQGNVDFVNPIPDTMSDSKDSSGILKSDGAFVDPINGMYFSEKDAEKFKDRKPVAVMVNNYVIARPSTGLSKADIIYEVVAEGGITRLMPVFYSRLPETVSSVRSARYYFVQLAAGYKAHYIHWGAAHVPPCQKAIHTSSEYCPPVNGQVETEPDVDAYDMIVKMGIPNLDGGNYACDGPKCAFSRDPAKVGKLPIEHTAFVRIPLVLELAKKIRPDESWQKYVPIVEWEFKDDALLEDRGDIGLTSPITYNYWNTMAGFNVKWVYDKDSNEYVRYQGGTKQIDAENGQELRAKSVIVRYTVEEKVGDKKHHLYEKLVGDGDALIFQDGQVLNAKWMRTNPDERDIYTDSNGNAIKFVRGQIWVQLVPAGNEVLF